MNAEHDPKWAELAFTSHVDGFLAPVEMQSGGLVIVDSGVSLARNHVNHYWFHSAFRTLPEVTARQAIAKADRFFSDVEGYKVFARNWCDADLIAEAKKVGLSVLDDNEPYMVASLTTADVDVPDWLQIDSVPSRKLIDDFASVGGRVFAQAPDDVEATRQVLDGVETCPWPTYYVAYLEGVPVATVNTWRSRILPGIYWVATVPEQRGSGIASCLVRVAMADLANEGYRAVTLQSTPEGHAMYLRLGFRDVGYFTVLARIPQRVAGSPAC